MKGGGYGLIGDIVKGIVGACVGGILFSFLMPGSSVGLLGSIVVAFIGAGVGAIDGGLIGALTYLGFEKDEAEYYDTGVRNGRTLVTVRDDDGRSESIFDETGAERYRRPQRERQEAADRAERRKRRHRGERRAASELRRCVRPPDGKRGWARRERSNGDVMRPADPLYLGILSSSRPSSGAVERRMASSTTRTPSAD